MVLLHQKAGQRKGDEGDFEEITPFVFPRPPLKIVSEEVFLFSVDRFGAFADKRSADMNVGSFRRGDPVVAQTSSMRNAATDRLIGATAHFIVAITRLIGATARFIVATTRFFGATTYLIGATTRFIGATTQGRPYATTIIPR
ncbi:MAG: hypothetical protein ONB12_08270 [candidate division KSB1 bacterium]|nr:hypothetical protein [candidate division KSB1 bacterium]